MAGGSTEKKRTFHKPNEGTRNQNEKVNKENEEFANSPIVKAFEQYSSELTAKHDKYERLVKLSRDITISSKRVIFAIHALSRSPNVEADKNKIRESLKNIEDTLLKPIAKELLNDDHFQFIKAYMWGLQEYTEAATFFEYVCSGNLLNFKDIVSKVSFEEPVMTEKTSGTGDAPTPTETQVLRVMMPLMDYVLGVHDLTGELMRYCITSFGANQSSAGHTACDFVKKLYSGMVTLSNLPYDKEHHKKMSITLQSLQKMEMACYAARIRASEAHPYQVDGDPDCLSESCSFYD